MRSFVTAAFAAVIMALSAHAPAHAQIQEMVRPALEWSTQFQSINGRVIEVLGAIPTLPEDPTVEEGSEFVTQARAWLTVFDQRLAEARAGYAALGSPASLEVGADMLLPLYEGYPAILSGYEQLSQRVRAALTAIHKGDPKGVEQAAVASLDAVILTIGQARSVNLSQAAAMPEGHPQKFLLLSYAASYEGFIAATEASRDAITAEPDVAAIAARIEAAVSLMRTHIDEGRAAMRTMGARLEVTPTANAEQEAFKQRLLLALQQYGPSFTMEEQMAQTFGEIVSLLRQPQGFAAVTYQVDAHLQAASEIDMARVADGQARAAFLQ